MRSCVRSLARGARPTRGHGGAVGGGLVSLVGLPLVVDGKLVITYKISVINIPAPDTRLGGIKTNPTKPSQTPPGRSRAEPGLTAPTGSLCMRGR